MKTEKSLEGVPPELHKEITDYLDFPDRFALRATCQTIRARTPGFTNDDLNDAEQNHDGFAAQHELWPCYTCRRLRLADYFTDKSRAKKKRRGGFACNGRFCIDCGINGVLMGGKIQKHYYKSGQRVKILKRSYIVCAQCKVLNPLCLFKGKHTDFCENCLEAIVSIEGFYHHSLAKLHAADAA